MNCPLCDCGVSGSSWMGKVNWNDKTFEYVQCASCASLYCEPMPNEADLARLYGQEYQDEFYATSTPASVRSNPAVRWLKKRRPATFLDYGCGSGALLGAAAALNWQIMGVEFDDEVAQLVAEKTRGNVVSDPSLLQEGTANVLHLGDVLEHLTRMNEQMPDILSLIKPGGYLIAQGPLENHANLFTAVLATTRSAVRAVKKLRGAEHLTSFPPYHVMLATADGQRKLFERFGLQEVQFTITEVAWPAPPRLTAEDRKSKRAVILFFLRRFSQMLSRIRPRHWGNRYFYVGRWNGA